MAILQANCPNCFERVEVDAAKTRVQPPRRDELGEISFTCPACRTCVELGVDRVMATNLLRFGASLEHTGRRAVPPRRARSSAPALTYDDLLDFHELLERADWFERLLALPR